MLTYTHNPKKKNHSYHIATVHGTLCKLENSGYYKGQVIVDTPPNDKKICSICSDLIERQKDGKIILTTEALLTTIRKLYYETNRADCSLWNETDQACLLAALRADEGYKRDR